MIYNLKLIFLVNVIIKKKNFLVPLFKHFVLKYFQTLKSNLYVSKLLIMSWFNLFEIDKHKLLCFYGNKVCLILFIL